MLLLYGSRCIHQRQQQMIKWLWLIDAFIFLCGLAHSQRLAVVGTYKRSTTFEAVDITEVKGRFSIFSDKNEIFFNGSDNNLAENIHESLSSDQQHLRQQHQQQQQQHLIKQLPYWNGLEENHDEFLSRTKFLLYWSPGT